MSIKPLSNASCFAKWCNAIGEAGLSLTGGIPVVQNFYQAMRAVRGARGKSRILRDPTFETGMMQLARGMDRKFHVPLPSARVSFWKAFGVTPDEQEALEGFFDALVITYTSDQASNLGGLPEVW